MSDTLDTPRDPLHLDLQLEPGADGREAPTIVVRGELDLGGAERMRAAADAALAATAAGPIGLDLADLTFIDSVGLWELLRLHRRAGEQGREVHVVACSTLVRRMIILAGLETVLRLPCEPTAG
ncbi:STAS domain-containing protein [Paraconexibacter antarcticus]|uniref:STAS domain-containing protein n=1 Tax=Paraconexibacter antarcticus TaxID=2949664 RepID=A0ABY5DX31_9ACTN|nr:STAS domain-containing protein [Paraconexibacter antarcticus]UTI66109.1 STAS domain-containing protein [Paraconexibacter antarcticus]